MSWAHSSSWRTFCGLIGMKQGVDKGVVHGKSNRRLSLGCSLSNCLTSTYFYSCPAVANLTMPRQLHRPLPERTGKLHSAVLSTHGCYHLSFLAFQTNKQCSSLFFAQQHLSLSTCQWMDAVKSATESSFIICIPSPMLLECFSPIPCWHWKNPCRRNHLLNTQAAQYFLLQTTAPWKTVFGYRGSRKKPTWLMSMKPTSQPVTST